MLNLKTHSGFHDLFLYWNLEYLNNVIIITTKVLLSQTDVTLADFGYPAYVLWFSCSQRFLNYFGFELTG
jgi:hypothetical protein